MQHAPAPPQDLGRVKSNVAKMVEQNAPEADIDAYIESEGVSLDQLRSFDLQAEESQRLQQAGAGGVYSGRTGAPSIVTKAGKTPQPTQRDRDYSGALAQAFADGGGQAELDAVSQKFGYPVIEAEQVNRAIKTRRKGGFVTFDIPVSGVTEVTEEQAQLGRDVEQNGPQTSELLGFQQGVANVVNKAAGKLETGLDMVGLADPINAASEAMGMAPSVGQAVASQQQIDATRGVQPGGVGRFVGEVTALAPTAMIPGGALAQGAFAGGIMSNAEDPLTFAKDVALGGAMSGTANAAMRGGSQLANPNLSPELTTLFQEGVRATPGQMARASGTNVGRAVGKVEDIVGGLPGIGAPIAAAQRAGVADFSVAPIRRALSAIKEKLPKGVEAGYNAIDYAQKKFTAAYQDVLPKLSGTLDNTFSTRVQAIEQRAGIPAGSQAEEAIRNARTELGRAFERAGPNGTFSGRTLRDASEKLNNLARTWRKSDDPYMRDAADVASQYRQQLHALARRQNPEQAQRLRDIDRGYASLVRAERGAVAGDGGIATPRQYQAAIRGEDQSARRRQFAAGNALDQDLGNAGVAVLANRAAQGGSRDINGLMAIGGTMAGAMSGNTGAQVAGLAGLGTLGATAATHNPLLLRGIQQALGRQTNISPETARVLELLAAASAPLSIAAANGQ